MCIYIIIYRYVYIYVNIVVIQPLLGIPYFYHVRSTAIIDIMSSQDVSKILPLLKAWDVETSWYRSIVQDCYPIY